MAFEKTDAHPARGKASVLISLLVAAALLRGWVGFSGTASLAEDPDSYRRLAITLAEQRQYGFQTGPDEVRPTAYRPPLYPAFLSLFVREGSLPSNAVAGLHWVLGMLTVALTYCLAVRFELRFPWLPALAVALDPLLLRSTQLVMTETLAATWAVAIWFCWCGLVGNHRPVSLRRTALGSAFMGALLGAAILTRPTAAPWAALLAAALLWSSLRAPKEPGSFHTKWMPAGIFCLAVAIVLAPWVIRNQMIFGHPIWGTTHGGYTLLLANNPPLYRHFAESGPSRNWDAEPFHQAWAARAEEPESDPRSSEYWFQDHSSQAGPTFESPADEWEDDRLAYDAASATIRREPQVFLLSSLYRCAWYWAWWPHDQGSILTRIGIGAWYGVWTALAIYALFSAALRKQWIVWVPGLLLVISLTLVHSVFWANMRMRAPVMPVVYLVACAGFGGSGWASGRQAQQ